MKQNQSVSGEIPLTSWFSKKQVPPKAEQRSAKRRQTEQDSSTTPAKKAKVTNKQQNGTEISEQLTASTSKNPSLLNYMQLQPARNSLSPQTPQLKSLSRANAPLPTPPDTTRPATKPRKTLSPIVTSSVARLEENALFLSTPPPSISSSSGFASSSPIEISDDDAPKSAETEVPSSQSQEMGGPHTPDDDFVASSQSQLLDIYENPSPRKNKRLKVVPESNPELIPSSQTQEWDLGTSYYNGQARFTNPTSRSLNRNLFGSFTDVSAQGDPINNICAELDALTSGSPTRANKEGSGDPQTIEVDQDAEHGTSPDENNDEDQVLSHSIAAPLDSIPLSPTNSYDDNTSPSPTSRSPEPVADYQESFPAESLPQEVKDFFDMFGDDEGSYPPDFPESLKD